MSDIPVGPGAQVPPDTLSLILAELQKLNAATNGLPNFVKKNYENTARATTNQEKFEQKLRVFFTKQQETDILKMDYQGRQLKEIVELNRQILKEQKKTAEAQERAEKALRSKEYQSKAAGIAGDYMRELRKSQDRNTLGTLGHHLGENFSGITGVLGILGNALGIKNNLGARGPGDFMSRKKAEEERLYNRAAANFRRLGRDTVNGAAFDDPRVYADMQGASTALDTQRMDFLNLQRNGLASNYARGYKRRGTGPGGGTSQAQADVAPAKQNPSASDVARLSAGHANGFLLLYNYMKGESDKAKADLQGTPTTGGGGLMGSLMSMLPAMLPLLLEAAVPLLIGGGIIALIAGIAANTNQRNAEAADLQKKNGLTSKDVFNTYGTSNLEATKLAAAAKNGDKSGISTAEQADAAKKLVSMNIANPTIGKVLVDTSQSLRKNAPWEADGTFRLTKGPNGYLFGGVPIPDDEGVHLKIMSREGAVNFTHKSWKDFAEDASTGLYSKMAFYNGGMVPGPVGQASLATVHGGEMMLTSSEVTQLRQTAVQGGMGPEALKTLNDLLAVNKDLLEEMKKNTDITAKSSVKSDTKAPASIPTPSKQFQRSN